ncbi:20802_t:CDS:2, partial [Gigaspora margarita]
SRIDQVWVSDDLSRDLQMADIINMEMIIESNHGTPLINLDLKTPSINKYNLVQKISKEKQAIFLLDKASKEIGTIIEKISLTFQRNRKLFKQNEKEAANLKEIENFIELYYKRIQNEQGKILNSLLDQPYNKIKINRVLDQKEENLVTHATE